MSVMYKKLVLLFLMLSICISGCANEQGATTENGKEYVSEVPEDECCICGSNDRSLMDYYRKSGMIGVVCLNTMNISSLDTRPYSNDGTEVLEEYAGEITTSHGEEECCFRISGMPSRGILEAEISYGKESNPDFEKIAGFVCQQCLDKVEAMYEEEQGRSDGKGRFPEVCLVDFATNELYTLGEHQLGYWIRDFWVHIDHAADKSNIMVVYAPEDKMEGYTYASDYME